MRACFMKKSFRQMRWRIDRCISRPMCIFAKTFFMRALLLILFAGLGHACFAQVFMRPFDNAAALALGGATVAYPGAGVGPGNDAVPGLGEKVGFFLGSALPYGISGWQTARFQGFARLSTNDGIGLDIAHSAIETYGEQQIRLIYGRRMGKKFLFGGNAAVLRASAPEYGSVTGMSFGLSILANPLPKVWLGARVQNPLQLKLAGEVIPSILSVGVAWQPSESFTMLAETEKDIDRPAQVRVGLEYKPANAFFLRIGFRTEPARLGFGAGFQLKNGLRLDAGAEWHPTLGLTPAAMLVWRKA